MIPTWEYPPRSSGMTWCGNSCRPSSTGGRPSPVSTRVCDAQVIADAVLQSQAQRTWIEIPVEPR